MILFKIRKYLLSTFDKSFLILGIGNISYILLIFFLRLKLSSSDYGVLALIFTVFNVIFSFGFLGLDFTIVRLANYNENRKHLYLPKINKVYLFIPLIYVIIIFYYFNFKLTFEPEKIFVVVFISFLSYFLNISYNILRLVKQFSRSQLVANLWKVAFLFISLGLHQTHLFELNNLIICFSISLGLSVFFTRRITIKFEKNNKTTAFFFQFFINTLLLLFVTHGEKFIIERSLGLEILGDYYFVSSFILYPFNFLQNYFGFKNTIELKSDKKLNTLRLMIINAFKSTILLILFVSVLFCIFSFYNLIGKIGFISFILLVGIGVTKVFYSVYSAAAGALISRKTLFKMNLYYISLIIFVSLLISGLSLTLNTIIVFIFVLWLGRLIIWTYGVRTIRN